jgi:hypothetical protein
VDELEQELPLSEGTTVPEWGGAQAGLPGKAFAKLLRDVESGTLPVVSYWKQTLIASDNRIAAMQCDLSTYDFAAARASGPLTVTARLHFRRSFQAEMDARGWVSRDILMEKQTLNVQPSTWQDLYLPLLIGSASW